MKNFFAVLTLAALAACGGSKATGPLAGKWEFEKMESPSSFSDTTAGATDPFADMMKELEADMKGTTYEFTGVNSCEVTKKGKTSESTYMLSDDKKTLTVKKDGSKRAEIFEIVKLDATELDMKKEGKTTILHFLKK